MSPVDDPLDLAASARDLLRHEGAETAGIWPRAAAALARQALELALDHLWQLRLPGMERTTARCQLLCLRDSLGDEVLAERAGVAWWALSRAMHHHPYELAPTHAELEGWIGTVWEVADRVARIETEAAARPR